MKKRSIKNIKKEKLEPLPKIYKRLYREWSLKVRSIGHCELCGIKVGDIRNGKPVKCLNAHHLLPRCIKDNALRFDVKNGLCVCPNCHKYGSFSMHKNPIMTVKWLIENKNEQYLYVVKMSESKIDYKNRDILAHIEKELSQIVPL